MTDPDRRITDCPMELVTDHITRISRLETIVEMHATMVPKLVKDLGAIKYACIGGTFVFVAKEIGVLKLLEGLLT